MTEEFEPQPRLEEPPGAEAELGHEQHLHRRRHRHHPRSQTPLQKFLQRYRLELLLGGALVAGLFLLFGPLARSIQPGEGAADQIVPVFERVVATFTNQVNALIDRIWNFFETTNWAVKLGSLLLLAVIIAVPLRVRWWLLHDSPWLRIACPRCNSDLHRVHRNAFERLISKIVPIRHYRCSKCKWSGVRIDSDTRVIQASSKS